MLAAAPPLVADSDQLLSWARSRQTGDRERLLNKLTDLCAADPAGASAEVGGLLQDVLLTLVREAERDIRRRLAERLAEEPWAPHSLISILALDEIEIARPLIAASPVLKDRDLVRLLVEATVEHQIEVARRPAITALVVEAILTRSEPAVLSALAANATAEIDTQAMQRMVECSRRVAAMRAPLSRHPALTTELAERMYAWVGQTLREAIADRFHTDPVALQSAVTDAVRSAQAGHAQPAPAIGDPDREEMERRLVAKLAASGQLKAGWLLRALKEKKRGLFEMGLSTLTGFSTDDVRAAMTLDRPELMAYACVVIGVDRSVFPTFLGAVRDMTGGRPRATPDSLRRIDAAFQLRTADAARQAFRVAIAPPLKATG